MKKKLLIIAAMLFMIPQIALAKDYIKADDDISLNGTYNGSTLHLGSSINSDAKIKGIGAMAAQEINYNGESDYGILAGETLNINGIIDNDLYAAGQKLVINGKVKRDANIAGEDVTVNGEINRSIRIYGTTVTLENANIKNDVIIDASEIIIKGNVKIGGTLTYNKNAKISNNVGNYKTHTYILKKKEVTIADRIQNVFISIIGMLIVGFVISFIAPNIYEKLRNKDISLEEDLKTICIGFVALFAIPVACILLLISLFAAPIAAITLALYCIGIYLSTIFVGYVIAHNIITKGFKKEENEYLSILVGVIIVKLISYLPIVISGLLNVIILLYGVGLIINLIPKNIKK